LFSLNGMNIPIGNRVIGVAAFAACTFEGCRQIYRAKHVDRLEQEGKIRPDMAARIRKKPMRLIGASIMLFGVLVLLKELFRF
jgi:hypothetical protein